MVIYSGCLTCSTGLTPELLEWLKYAQPAQDPSQNEHLEYLPGITVLAIARQVTNAVSTEGWRRRSCSD